MEPTPEWQWRRVADYGQPPYGAYVHWEGLKKPYKNPNHTPAYSNHVQWWLEPDGRPWPPVSRVLPPPKKPIWGNIESAHPVGEWWGDPEGTSWEMVDHDRCSAKPYKMRGTNGLDCWFPPAGRMTRLDGPPVPAPGTWVRHRHYPHIDPMKVTGHHRDDRNILMVTVEGGREFFVESLIECDSPESKFKVGDRVAWADDSGMVLSGNAAAGDFAGVVTQVKWVTKGVTSCWYVTCSDDNTYGPESSFVLAPEPTLSQKFPQNSYWRDEYGEAWQILSVDDSNRKWPFELLSWSDKSVDRYSATKFNKSTRLSGPPMGHGWRSMDELPDHHSFMVMIYLVDGIVQPMMLTTRAKDSFHKRKAWMPMDEFDRDHGPGTGR